MGKERNVCVCGLWDDGDIVWIGKWNRCLTPVFMHTISFVAFSFLFLFGSVFVDSNVLT